VSRAIGLLKQGGYVVTDEDGYLRLTEIGLEAAAKTYERHTILTELFIRLGVDDVTATEDACKVEHDLSDKTFLAIKAYVENLK
jgi:Mn-dependent DtxR family transcriptional regulator